jgi:ketosteroid isomerase-like protein
VYAKRDGQWKFVSHRTVFGPNDSPAGVDPNMITTPEQAKAYVPGRPEINVPPKTYPPPSPEAAEVLAFEKSVGDAIVRGDVAYFDKVTDPTLRMIHGDNWTRGAESTLVDTKETFLDRVRKKQYNAHEFDSVRVDMHGDIAITYGRYVAQIAGRENTDRPWFSVWFHRIYQKQNGQWTYVAHRTIHGASHGTREIVSLR